MSRDGRLPRRTSHTTAHPNTHSATNDEEDPPRTVPRLLDNHTVLAMLLQRRTATRARRAHRDWVEAEAVQYLQATMGHTDTTSLVTAQTMRDRRPQLMTTFGLTEAEALQVINTLPTELVEIHLIVEDLHERLTVRKQEELIATVQEYVHGPPSKSNSNNNGAAEEDDAVMDDHHDSMTNGDGTTDAENHTTMNGKTVVPKVEMCDDGNDVIMKREDDEFPLENTDVEAGKPTAR